MDVQLEQHQPVGDGMSRALRIVEIALVAFVLATAAGAVVWSVQGGSFYAVETASMGEAAPVGTLVIDRPASRLQVGDLITFRPPGIGRIFTHRIVGFTETGGIRTKGDINGAADSWTLPRTRVLGRVVTTVRYAGWVLRAIPILALGI